MKRIILFVLVVFSTNIVKAQYESQWQLGFPEQEDFSIITTTRFSGGYALLGTFSDTVRIGDITLCSRGGKDVLLMQLDTLGVIENAISFGNKYEDVASSIFCHNDTLFVCGQTVTDSLREFFIYSFDESFHQLSNLAIPFQGKIQTDLLKVVSGNLLLGGSMKGIIMLCGRPIVNEHSEHAFFIELSDTGDLLSSWQTSGSGLHRLHSFISNDNGDIILLLNTGKGTLDMPNASPLILNNNGVVMARYDSNWNMKSCFVINCTGYIEATEIMGNETGYILGLNYNGIMSLDKRSFSSQNTLSSLLIQFDLENNPMWFTEIKSDDHCRLQDIDISAETIVCTGYYYGKLLVENEVLGQTMEKNTFLMAFDNEGHLSWSIDVDGIGTNIGQNLVCDYNSVMLNGTNQITNSKNTAGIVLANNKNETYVNKYVIKNKDDEDKKEDTAAIAKKTFDMVTDQDFNNSSDNSFVIEVYPNPVKNVLHWNTSISDNWLLELIDIKGVLLAQKKYDEQSEGYLDLSSCKPGIYIIRLSSIDNSGYHIIVKN